MSPFFAVPGQPSYLTGATSKAIANGLSAEEARRRNVIPRELSFVVDGIEHGRLNLEESRELRFRAPDGARLLEIWTEDEHGPLLLATHMMRDGDTANVEKKFALALKGGRSVSVVVKKAADEHEENPWQLFVLGEDVHHTPIASSARNWLVRAPAFPAFAGIAVLFLAVVLLSAGLWKNLEKARARNSELYAKLVRERAAHTSSHEPEIQTIARYRLTPAELTTRGNDDIKRHPVAVPAAPTVIELVLPVARIHGRYRCVLTPWDGDKRILVEGGLSANFQGAETVVTCRVPSDLLVSGQYYRVELRDTASHYVRTFTFCTAPAQH